MEYPIGILSIFTLAMCLSLACDDSNETTGKTTGSDREELPDGWEDAKLIETAQGLNLSLDAGCDSAVSESPSISGGIDGTGLRIEYEDCFPCMSRQEAFLIETGQEHKVLMRPINDGGSCGVSRYDIRFKIPKGKSGDRVSIYRQDINFYSSKPILDPYLIETVTVNDSQGDCNSIDSCDEDAPCDREGMNMDDVEQYTMSCVALDSCGGSYCIWDGEACMMECGHQSCSIDSITKLIDCSK